MHMQGHMTHNEPCLLQGLPNRPAYWNNIAIVSLPQFVSMYIHRITPNFRGITFSEISCLTRCSQNNFFTTIFMGAVFIFIDSFHRKKLLSKVWSISQNFYATKIWSYCISYNKKLLFTISVVKDHLVFVTEIHARDDFVQESLCVKQVPAEDDQRPPDFAHTQSHSPGVYDHCRVHLYPVVGLCKLRTTFCVKFEPQR